MSPYSLGKLIDWKHSKTLSISSPITTPYSLGKLIDWKLDAESCWFSCRTIAFLPTR
jgi:hypothetical protein